MQIPVREANNNARITMMLMQHVVMNNSSRCGHPADFAGFFDKFWWKMLEFVALRQTSVTFFSRGRLPETPVSRWSRIKVRITRLVKGLCKDQKAQILAVKHWLEAIDPCHRHGFNLHLYYVAWLKSQSPQPFFYWLDFGDGREVHHMDCPRQALRDQCVQYLGPKEREAYEVSIRRGKLEYTQGSCPVDTNSPEETKWIFVLSTSRKFYVGRKIKGLFQHSSFLAGAPVLAAGRIIVCNGILQAIWSYSGHYRPKDENFLEMIRFLERHDVELSNVKTFAMDDDVPPPQQGHGSSSSCSSEMGSSQQFAIISAI